MDTGRPPPLAVSQEAHAGCLSFELSWKQHRLVVNCGLPAVNRETWRQVARATAAHSTVTFNERSSCRFLESGSLRRLLAGIPIVGGPPRRAAPRATSRTGVVSCAPRTTATPPISALIHTRRCGCRRTGRALDGEDSFRPAAGEALRRAGFAARFVTGYLYSPSAKVRGAGATHAWCEAFLPDLGWIDLDPTNGLAESPGGHRRGGDAHAGRGLTDPRRSDRRSRRIAAAR